MGRGRDRIAVTMKESLSDAKSTYLVPILLTTRRFQSLSSTTPNILPLRVLLVTRLSFVPYQPLTSIIRTLSSPRPSRIEVRVREKESDVPTKSGNRILTILLNFTPLARRSERLAEVKNAGRRAGRRAGAKRMLFNENPSSYRYAAHTPV